MISKTVCCFAAIFVFFSQANGGNVASNLNYLKGMIGKGEELLRKADENILNARENHEKMTEERLHCLNREYNIQRNAVNGTSQEAVARAMFKGKSFASFQCVASGGREAFDKLDAVFNQIPGTTDRLIEKSLVLVRPFRFILTGLQAYTQGLYQKKKQEITQTQNDDLVKKILAEVEGKMKLLGDIVDQINSKVTGTRFAFFEEFVTFAHSSEGSLRKIQREGSQKMLKCVA